ncbi:hypothetical protein KF913_21785 [Candidatus Obscuribacterales bacterium]|nr:hypothetical protein [Candidatus Obscuribacterales bacterium]
MGMTAGLDVPTPMGGEDGDKQNPWVNEVFSAPKPEPKQAEQAPTQATGETADGKKNVSGQPEAQEPVDVSRAGTDKPVSKNENATAVEERADKSAQYVSPDMGPKVDGLISVEQNTVRKDVLERLKGEKSNAARIELIESLLNGKLDNQTRQEILAPEANPERRKILEELISGEKQIELRYRNMRETVMKTLPDYKEFFLSGDRDQERQSVYLALIKEDGASSSRKLKETLGLETDAKRQEKLNSLINDNGDLDRVSIIKELMNSETDARKKQLLSEILKHETNIGAFGKMIDEQPSESSIKTVTDIFSDKEQAARLTEIVKTTNESRSRLLDQLGNQAEKPEFKAEVEKLKKEERPEERVKVLNQLLSDCTDGPTQGRLRQLLSLERKLGVMSDLPAEETRRKELYAALDKVSTGDYDSVMKAYPLCAEWLKSAVPDAFVEAGYQMGMAIKPGCPLKLPIEHGRPIPPRLMEMYAKEGRIKLDMEMSPEKLLNPSEKLENVAKLKNAVDWLYPTKAEIREEQLKYEAKTLVDTLKLSFGPEGVAKYGPDGIPKGWMPPEKVEDIPAWRDRVLNVVNLGNRLRNYAQAMKTISGIQDADQGLEELKQLGVQFEFGKNNQLIKFVVPQLDGLDLRLGMPANGAQVKGLESWLSKHTKEVDKALDPYRDAMEQLIADKNPGAFLRHGDFPFNEGLHKDIGVPYDLISQRVTKVEQKGGNIVIEGTISYQTSSWYSYNYWLGCEPVSRNMSDADFRQLNGIAAGAEPKEGEKYKITGADGKEHAGWTFRGKNPDGSLKFDHEETFRFEKPAGDYVPAMSAMGNIQLIKGDDVNRWLYGAKIDSVNPANWELPQVGFWHHGLKYGKLVMDVGLTVYGGAGIAARGASWGARAMSLGRVAVGTAGLTHHIIDTKLPKEWRDGIHMASHAFILADVGLGLGVGTFKKAFGIGAAAKESANLLNTLGHGALAVDGIAIFGPVVAADIKNVVDNHMGWTTQQVLERALNDRGTPDRLVSKEINDKPAAFNLKDRAIRDSMEVMVDRLGKTVLTETTDEATKARVEKLITDGKAVMGLDRNDPKRQKFVADLSKLFTPSDAAVLWNHISGQPGKFEAQFRRDAQAKVGVDQSSPSSQEKLIASALALVLQANEKGELPGTVLKREVVIPAHKEYRDGKLVEVAQSTKEVSVSRDEIAGLAQRLAETSELPSIKMAASKMLWRMGKLDHNGLAGVLLEVAQKSNNRELAGMALIDNQDVSLGFLLNDITHREVVAASGGYVSLQEYRARNYGLTSDDLKRDLKALISDGARSADVRAMATELLMANDLDKVEDRKRALVDCDQRWQRQHSKDGGYAADFVKSLKYQAQQEVTDRPVERKVKVMEKGVEKDVTLSLSPEEIKLEKFRALSALKNIGVIKVDGEDYRMPVEQLNGQFLKCLSGNNIDLTLGVIKNIDFAKLSQSERKQLLGVLGWPTTEQSVQAKVEVLKAVRDIVGGDAEVARETKSRLLDMLNPASTRRGSEDYSWVGAYPDLHAGALTALASFGCQYHTEAIKATNLSRVDFEAKLAPGESKELIRGKYYQLKEGDSTVWYRYSGTAQDGSERFIKQGDPTVAVLVQHLKGGDRIGSAQVRLAAIQAAGDLQIPGLRELMVDAIKQETDPRVAKRLREVRFPEEPPLDPKSDASIDKLNEYMTQVLQNKQFSDLDHYGKWMKATYPLLFDHKFRDELSAAIKGVYGDGFFSGVPFMWDKTFGSKSPDQYWDEAVKGVDDRYEADLKKLIDGAKSSPDAATRENSIMSLLFVITTRGAGTAATDSQGMPFRWKDVTISRAVVAFSEMADKGAKERGGAAKWAVEKLLTQQPDLHPDYKQVLLTAAIKMAKADEGQTGDQAMTKEHLSKVLYLALKATAGFPKPADSERYNKEVEYHKDLIYYMTAMCRDAGATELLEAVAKEHPAKEVREQAEWGVRFMRDGISRNLNDAFKNPDTLSTASQRRDAILSNLTNPEKSTEEVVRAIAKAVAGYDWRKPENAGANNEAMRSALRKAMSDPRVRVKMVASTFLLETGDGFDIAMAAETLQTISTTPYKYGSSDRELKYYKIEADEVMNRFLRGIEKAPKEIRDNRVALVERGKELSRDKQDGVMAYSFIHPDNKSLASAQQELEGVLESPNSNEIDIVKALFYANGKHQDRVLGPTEPLLGLYRTAMEHRSEKVRAAAADCVIRSATNEADLLKATRVLKEIVEKSGNVQLKKEASARLTRVADFSNFDVSGVTAAADAALPSTDRAKTLASVSSLLKDGKEDQVLQTAKEVLSIRSNGILKSDDPALNVLRDALNSKYAILQLAAAVRLVEQSPNAADLKRVADRLVDIQKSNLPQIFRKDAANILKKLSDSNSENAKMVSEVQAAADKSLGMIIDVVRDLPAQTNGDLKVNAEKLAAVLAAAKNAPSKRTSDDAIKSIYSNALNAASWGANSEVTAQIRDAALSHPDERVRLTAAWMLAQVAPGQDDASTGYMALAKLSQQSKDNTVKIESMDILNAVIGGQQQIIDSTDAAVTIQQKTRARWSLGEIARHRDAVLKAASMK